MSVINKLYSNSSNRLDLEHFWTPLVTALRYRYHKDKIERGPLHTLRLGYKDTLFTEGLYPRHKSLEKMKKYPEYCPPNPWREEEALSGRNDYIDILGDSDLKPTDVSYNVPKWLRGFRGNEFQMLIKRNKIIGPKLREYQPCQYQDMQRRIKYLYIFLNTKKRDYYWKADRSKS